MRKKTLSERLLKVTAFVSRGGVVADIGCDNAFASIYLIEQGIAKKCIASDVRDGPVQSARANIKAHGLEGRIDVRLASGLSKVAPGEADTILIAGMGGMLMEKILREDLETALSAKEWVLEPQSDAALVRKFIRDCGFVIDAEDMAVEEGKYYPVMHAVKGESDLSPSMLALYDRFGKILLESGNPLVREYLTQGKAHYESVIAAITALPSMDQRTQERLSEMRSELELVEQALKLI